MTYPTLETREVTARELIDDLRKLQLDIHRAASQLIDLKRYRDEAKARILAEGSRDDPKALGANETLRTNEVNRLYLELPENQERDEQIAALETQVPFLQVDYDWKRRLLHLEMALIPTEMRLAA